MNCLGLFVFVFLFLGAFAKGPRPGGPKGHHGGLGFHRMKCCEGENEADRKQFMEKMKAVREKCENLMGTKVTDILKSPI